MLFIRLYFEENYLHFGYDVAAKFSQAILKSKETNQIKITPHLIQTFRQIPLSGNYDEGNRFFATYILENNLGKNAIVFNEIPKKQSSNAKLMLMAKRLNQGYEFETAKDEFLGKVVLEKVEEQNPNYNLSIWGLTTDSSIINPFMPII